MRYAKATIVAALALVIVFLTGCGQTCTPDYGDYDLANNSVTVINGTSEEAKVVRVDVYAYDCNWRLIGIAKGWSYNILPGEGRQVPIGQWYNRAGYPLTEVPSIYRTAVNWDPPKSKI